MRNLLDRSAAWTMDGAMCALMNALQWRRSLRCSREELDAYLAVCETQTREEFYAVRPLAGFVETNGWLTWDSPVSTGLPENDRARARFFATSNPSAPTVLLLHALMSASDAGYRRVALWFNARGWNVVFPHLPFHYSRTPRGYLNGELAITAHLIRNGETLRQGVMELRQIMAELRLRGCREFGVIGTSLGGWSGALLSFLEEDFRFVSLIQPIVNVEHAIWQSPGSRSMRRILRTQGIEPGQSERHAPLSSPLHGAPRCGADRVLLTSGLYDTVSPPAELRKLHRQWPGSQLLEVRQGHFGYQALPRTLAALEPIVTR